MILLQLAICVVKHHIADVDVALQIEELQNLLVGFAILVFSFFLVLYQVEAILLQLNVDINVIVVRVVVYYRDIGPVGWLSVLLRTLRIKDPLVQLVSVILGPYLWRELGDYYLFLIRNVKCALVHEFVYLYVVLINKYHLCVAIPISIPWLKLVLTPPL